MKKRILSVFLTFALVFGVFSVMLPMSGSEAHAVTDYQRNIVKRANYLYNKGKWTCQKNVEGWEMTFEAGQTYNIPYGQPVYSGHYIGYKGDTLDDAVVDEYLAAAADANSLFYSARSHCGGTTAPYYAMDSSAFVSWCWGISRKTAYSLQYVGTNLGLANQENYSKLEIGDALNSNSVGSAALVTDLKYDGNGAITQIEITEMVAPQLSRTIYSPADFIARFGSNYYIMRWSGQVPAAPGTVTLPVGCVDYVLGRDNAVYVSGWAYDPDDPSANIEIHIYVGGKPGDAGAQGRPIVANLERPDVDAAAGCGPNHGFEILDPVSLTGEQPVYIYAIDSDDPNTNVLLTETTATITHDTENPKAEPIQVNSSDLEGFEVSSKVSDNSGVASGMFYVWTKEDQSDMKTYQAVVSEAKGELSCKVMVADFPENQSKFYVDLYLFDFAGNTSSVCGFTTTYNLPVGNFEEAVGGAGTIQLKGWAFDADNLEESLEIHVYVGEPAGSPTAEFHKFMADQERTDLDQFLHCGPNHGFDTTIETTLIGEQTVYLYAINVGNGNNMFIDSKTVTITSDPNKPAISDIKVDSSDLNGFTISCKIKDNVTVSNIKFPTWTADNPDHKIWYEGKIENGVATCTVPIADFDNYEGTYIIHIYAYDIFNNSVVYPFSVSYYLPKGCLDEVSNAIGGIKVRGWAYDDDRAMESVEVHVYIGGPAGSPDAQGFIIIADKLREDVNDEFHCGEYHGFENILYTKLTGEQDVYVYAINKGNGDNVLIGQKTVTIIPTLYGDADHDSEISIGDVTCIQENIAGILEMTDEQRILADVNGNAVIDIRDATYIQLYLAKKIEMFPVTEAK